MENWGLIYLKATVKALCNPTGYLPDAGGGPWTPRKTRGTPEHLGRMATGVVTGEEKWRLDVAGIPAWRLGKGRGLHT